MKKSILLLIITCLPLLAKAEKVKVNGIWYNLIEKAGEAEVAPSDDDMMININKTSINIPETIEYNNKVYQVTAIGSYAFRDWIKLVSISIPNTITKIGDGAFRECASLESIILPNSVKTMGTYLFLYCHSLKNVTLPNEITEIPSYMFQGCNSLTTLNFLGNHVEKISQGAFRQCTKLTEAIIPDNVKEIGSYAFSGCSDLRSIMISRCVQEIGRYAFVDAINLENVYCYTKEVPILHSSAFNNSYIELCTLHVPKASIEDYKKDSSWSNFGEIVELQYNLTYEIDGGVYKSYELNEDELITPEEEPKKDGYTFSGWSEIPKTMPAENVTVTGSFIPNKYTLTYVVDGITYQTVEIECDAVIPTNSIPTKEGYTFVTNDDIPKTMPAHDVTVTGSFILNKYTLTYVVDGITYQTVEIECDAEIPTNSIPTKEGYTFVANDEIPNTMPAHNVTITGSFVVNKYMVTYIVDGETYKTIEVEYGASIPQENTPVKEGHTFIGWDEIPDAMPAHDIMVKGVFAVNTYTITYLLDGTVYTTVEVEFGTKIELIDVPQKEGYIFMGWNNALETMPAYDIIIYGNYEIDTTGISDAVVNEEEYSIYTTNGVRINTLQKGVNIIRTTNGQTKKVYVK